MTDERAWLCQAIARIEADACRSADTHLIRFPLPEEWGIDLYFKDESKHPTGSLKHRLARSLFLHALCSGWIGSDTVLVEASSGSTAVSEAYFAKMIGLRFVAVMPSTTSPEKVALISQHGGACHFVDHAREVYAEAERVAAEHGGHYLDQFTFADRATDWRGNNNIAESIFAQMAMEPHGVPTWVVVGAGTGGTSSTIGRYIRYRKHPTALCVVDPENSVFADFHESGDAAIVSEASSRIEGIGRPRVEPSFQREVVDRMIRVPDTGSLAAMRLVSERLGWQVGASTGTNAYGALQLIAEMLARGEQGSVVSLICDGGERYQQSYYDERWLESHGLDLGPSTRQLTELLRSGAWQQAS